MKTSSKLSSPFYDKMCALKRLLVFLTAFVLTACEFTEIPQDGNRLEFHPLIFHWQHTFDNIRGCIWVHYRSHAMADEDIIRYGMKEGLEVKRPGWELSDINNPCSGGIQKKTSVLADTGNYELRIVAEGRILRSGYIKAGIIQQIDRSIHVSSNGETSIQELLPGRDMNKTLTIKNSTNVYINLNEKYPDATCMTIQMFRNDDLTKFVDVFNKTFHVEYDVDITHITLTVALDVVDFSSFSFTLLVKKPNIDHQSTTSITLDTHLLKPGKTKVPLIAAFVSVGGVVLAIVLGFVLHKYCKKQNKENSPHQIGEISNQLDESKELHYHDTNKTLARNDDAQDYITLKYKCMVGSEGSQLHQFNRPYSVICTSDQIIVADGRNHRLKFYNNNLDLQFVIGEEGSGQGQFHVPVGLEVSREGEVFVCDLGNHRIVVLSLQGEYLREFGTPGDGLNMLKRPQGIRISDGLLYIADSKNYRIKVVKLDGTFVRHIGSKGSNPGQFENRPIRVAVMSPGDGRVLVCELKKSQLHVYKSTGEYIGLFSPSVPTDLATALPNDVTVDPYDNVLISYTNQLAVYDKEGDLITVIGSRGTGQGQFVVPRGVAVNTTERFIIVCDKFNHRVKKFVFNSK